MAADLPPPSPIEPTAPPPQFPVNQGAIKLLSEALERAKRGELNAVGMAWIGASGSVGWAWHFGTQPQPMLLAGTQCLARDVIDSATGRLNTSEPPPGTVKQ